jgi:hypothetical protein
MICEGQITLKPSDEIVRGMVELQVHNSRVDTPAERIPFFEATTFIHYTLVD